MANAYPGLKKIGQFWHYELRVNGHRLHGSTKATDLPTAKKVLEAKRREALEGQYRIVSRIPTLKELFDQWFNNHRAVFSVKHLVPVECIYRNWLHPRLGAVKIDQIGGNAVDALRSEAITLGRSPRYVNNILQVLRLLLNYGVKLGSIKDVPIKIRMARIQKKPRQILPGTRVQEFLTTVDQSAKNPHVPVMLRVMVGLGLRESEVLGMRLEWFDMENQTYTVGKAKGKEARVLPVPAWLWSAIHEMPKVISPWVFPAVDGKPHRSQYCKNALGRVCKKLGLGNVTQHSLRATFASLHAEAGTPIPEIQGMLGHKSIQTTMLYVEQSLDAKRKAQDALGKRLGLG
ncbi:MAG: site-specific integrase [Holophaga sp.]|jgi:integrase